MKIKTNTFASALLLPCLVTLSYPAMAHGGHDGYSKFDQRIERQQQRIKKGLRSGDMTRKEAKTLRQQQRHISKLNRLFARDGHLDRHERRTLRQELKRASKRIHNLRHNDHVRAAAPWRHDHSQKKSQSCKRLKHQRDHDRSARLSRQRHD